jgi:hypothetical protein
MVGFFEDYSLQVAVQRDGVTVSVLVRNDACAIPRDSNVPQQRESTVVDGLRAAPPAGRSHPNIVASRSIFRLFAICTGQCSGRSKHFAGSLAASTSLVRSSQQALRWFARRSKHFAGSLVRARWGFAGAYFDFGPN